MATMRARPILTLLFAGCATFHPVSAPTNLRVVSYNIQAGAGHLDSTADAIRGLSADIVGLQEVDVHWSDRSQFVDQATELGRRLGMAVRFAPIYRLAPTGAGLPMREFGVALLSRFPIVS